MNDFIILISIWTLKSTKEVNINPEKIMIISIITFFDFD